MASRVCAGFSAACPIHKVVSTSLGSGPLAKKLGLIYPGVEQRSARRPHKSEVVGSNPTPGTINAEVLAFCERYIKTKRQIKYPLSSAE